MKKYVALFIPLFILIVSCSLPEPSDIVLPTVRVIFPYEGAVVSDNFQINVQASDNDEVKEVWCYVDGKEIGRLRKSPYLFTLNIANYEKKINHVLVAAARDKEGNIGYSANVNFVISDSEDDTNPTVVILNPQSGQTVEGIVNVRVHADDDRSVQKVRLYIDGLLKDSTSSYPYLFNWNTTGYSDSTSHTLVAEAIDGGNNNAFSPVVTVTVYPRSGVESDNVPPAVLFLYPINGETVSGTVRVSVDMRDANGIKRSEFYVDGQQIASADNPDVPWVFDWNTGAIADTVDTRHSLYVKAYDPAGNVGTSGLLVVTVRKK
jgi:hypothetical protein